MSLELHFHDLKLLPGVQELLTLLLSGKETGEGEELNKENMGGGRGAGSNLKREKHQFLCRRLNHALRVRGQVCLCVSMCSN